MLRSSAVRGQFYPASGQEIETYCRLYDQAPLVPLLCALPRAWIVPHAGYVFSGFTASCAYRVLAKSPHITRLVVIGPSHRVPFQGISGGNFCEGYETPLGPLAHDQVRLEEFYQAGWVGYYEQAHREHSTETQFPLIKRYRPDMKIVELVYGRVDVDILSKIIDHTLQDPQSGIIISTDLSHYFSLEEAKKIDQGSLEAIKNHDKDKATTCDACGRFGVAGLMDVVAKEGLITQQLDYRTSALANGDIQRVVGYTSWVIGLPSAHAK